MNHLNEDKLIQYAFNLMELQENEAVQQHLEICGDCQSALDALKAKFAVMDSLADEVPPSEELIAQTLAHSKQKPEAAAPGSRYPVANVWHRVIASCRSRSTLLFRWVEWSAAAAAVVLICFLMLQNLPDTQNKNTPPTGSKLPASESADAPLAKGNDLVEALPLHQSRDSHGAGSLPDLSSAVQKAKGEGGKSDKENSIRVVSAGEIPNTPPFAPASAIELVVLPKPDKTQVTIYNSADLTLVRDTRKLTLKPGWNWLQFMWDGTLIDPTSLSLTPLEHADKIDIQQLVYPARLKDIGRWLIRSEVEGSVPFEITYFASGLSWRAFYMGTTNEDETTMDLKGYVNVSNNSGQDFVNTQTRLIVGQTRLTEDIAYLAQRRYPYGPDIVEDEEGEGAGIGGSQYYYWHGIQKNEKVPLLGDMPILGRMFVATDGEDDFGSTGFVAGYDIKKIEKTGLSEYFLYTIEGMEDLPNTWAKRLPSFDIEDIPVKSLYKYDEGRYGNQAVRFVSFANDTEHELGETPIPEGSIKIYRDVNEQKNLSYIGQSSIKYIPVNEDIELNLGPARLVKVEPVLMEYKTDNYVTDKDGNIFTGYLIENGRRVYNMIGFDEIETWQVKTTNTRDIPVDIEITRNFGTDAWELELESSPPASEPRQSWSGQFAQPVLRSSESEGGRGLTAADNVVYKKHDKSRARFTLTIPAKTETTFTYTVTKYQGKRTEAYVEKMKEEKK